MSQERIHIDNYEAFLLDAMEGTISVEDQQALNAFLDAHPELKAEAEGLTLHYLEPEEAIVFPHKAELKKREGGVIISLLATPVWMRIAAAAVLTGLVVTVWTTRPAADQPAGLATHTEQPVDTADTDTSEQTEKPSVPSTETPLNEETDVPSTQEDKAPARNNTPLRIVLPSNANTDFIASTEEPSILETRQSNLLKSPLGKETITQIDRYEPVYNTGIAMYEPLRPADIPTGEQPAESPTNNLFNTILSKEVARNFLPEIMTEPESNESSQEKENTIILELPRSGKKIIDTFLKND